MLFIIVKTLHLVTVILTFTGFVGRGILRMRGSALMNSPVVRIAPHVVDTLLLGSAIALMLLTRQYPFVEPWLTAKVIALVLYIALGIVAFRARSKSIGVTAWVLALIVFLYIVAVAHSRQVLPFTV